MDSCASSDSVELGTLAKSNSSLSVSSIVSELRPAVGSKRKLSVDATLPTAKSFKQPCSTGLTLQEQDTRSLVLLSRSDSAISADTQLLCTEAFNSEDDSSSALVPVAGEGFDS